MKSLSPLAFLYISFVYTSNSAHQALVFHFYGWWLIFFIRKNKFDLLVKTNTYILIICNRRWKNIRPDQDLNQGLLKVWSNELPNIIGLNWSVIISPIFLQKLPCKPLELTGFLLTREMIMGYYNFQLYGEWIFSIQKKKEAPACGFWIGKS